MTYNKQNLPQYVETAGQITILTAITGVLIFAFIFLFNIGKNEIQKVEAVTNGAATTTLTVLNTPPVWTVGLEGREEFESSTSTPTNSSSDISWVGSAVDANGAPYFMIVCENNATPTPHAAVDNFNLGTAAPTCTSGVEWGVSASTTSGAEARVSTTTTEVSPFAESNVWYAWVCDDDPVNPRCSATYSQGVSATNTSPFNVNRRPVFTGFYNSSPTDPGQVVVFNSTSSDPDSVDTQDEIYLIVCSADTYSTTTNECGPGDFIASTSISTFDNASSSYTLPAIIQDTNYDAFGYVYDIHGHSATGGAEGTNVQFTVANVAPTVAGGTLSLNGGQDIVLTVPAAETTGFLLDFVIADANSCDAVGGGSADEITDYVASVFRSGVGTSTCDGSAGSYDPNSCYPSGVGASVWNISCTASSTSCTGSTDDTIVYNCTFPLWFIADPTNGLITDTPFYDQKWSVGIAGVDDDTATGTMATSTTDVELLSLVAIDLLDQLIAYDQLEPGDAMANLTASTTLQVIGNTGLNQLLGGDSMCGTYASNNPCPVSATTTIPESEQHYATSSIAYGSGAVLQPTSTPALLDIRIPKPTSTSTPSTGDTFWGIAVPGTISLSGAYTGQNTFLGDISAPGTW